MSKMTVAVNIAVNHVGDGLNTVQKDLRGLSGAAKAANADASVLAGTIGRVAAGLGGLAVVMKSFDAMRDIVAQGFQFNAQMEQSRLSLAALIGAFGQVRDASGGAMDTLATRLEVAAELQQKLKVAALQTTATYEDMVQALQVGLGPALKAGFNTDQVLTFTRTVTQAAAAIGLPMNQLGQEIRSLFQGDIGPDSRLANLLFSDVPRNRIKAYVEGLQSSGKFFDEMQQRIRAFAEAGERAGDTMLGAWSNLKDAVQQAIGEGTQGQFRAATNLIKDLTKEVVTFDEEGRATFNQDLVDGVNAITGAFVGLGERLLNLAKTFDDVGLKLRAFKQLASESTPDLPNGMTSKGVFRGILALGTLGVSEVQIAAYEKLTEAIERRASAITAGEALISAKDRKTRRDLGDFLLRAALPSGVAFGDDLTKETAISRLGDFGSIEQNGPRIPKVIEAITKSAKDGLVTLDEFNKALALTLGAKPGSGGAGSVAKDITKEREKELALLAKISGESAKAVDLGLLRHNVIKATSDEQRQMAEYSLKAKEIELRELDALTAVANMKHATDLQKEAAVGQIRLQYQQEYQQLDAEYDRQKATTTKALYQSQKKAIDDALAGYDEMIEKGRELTRAVNEATVQAFRDALKKIREPWEQFYRSVGDGMKRAMASVLDGGGLRGAFDAFFQSVFDTVGENFAKAIDGWMEKLSLMASGQRDTGMKDSQGNPIYEQYDWGKRGTAAKGGMLALQGGAALYGLYTNPAPKQGQNMLSGAMSGAALGASVGGPYAWATAIIGAFVGAIAGAFAPTEKGKNIRILGTANGIYIHGMDSDWGGQKLTTEINQAIRGTAAKLDEIFLGLPTAALEAMGNWRPDLGEIDVTGKGDGKNWNEELDNYLKDTLPKRVFDAYGGAISGAMKFVGVTDQRINEFTAYIKKLKPDEALTALKNYLDVLYGLDDIMKMFGVNGVQGRRRAAGGAFSPGESFTREAYARADRGPLADFDDMKSRLGVLSKGFDDLTHEEQVARGKQILDLSRQFFQGMEEYLIRLREMQRGMNESVDQQIRDINYDQISDPKKRADFLLAEQRDLYDRLAKATNAEEVNRIMSQIQSNAGALYDLLGRTPEAAEQAKKQLEEARALANERYKIFTDNAQKMLDDAYKIVQDILTRLRDGLGEVLGDEGGGGPGTGGGDGEDGGGPGRPGRDLRLLAEAAGLSTTGLTNAAQAAQRFASVLAMAAAQPPVIILQPGPTNVNVELSGTAEPLINSVVARVAPAVTSQVLTAQSRQAIRSRATGRR